MSTTLADSAGDADRELETVKSALVDMQKTLDHMSTSLRCHQGQMTSRIETCEKSLLQQIKQTRPDRHVVFHLSLHVFVVLLVIVCSWSFGVTKYLSNHHGNPDLDVNNLHSNVLKIKEVLIDLKVEVEHVQQSSRDLKLKVEHVQESVLLHSSKGFVSPLDVEESERRNTSTSLPKIKQGSSRSRFIVLQSMFLKHIRTMMNRSTMATSDDLKRIENVHNEIKTDLKELRNETILTMSNSKYETPLNNENREFVSEFKQGHGHVLFLLRLILFLPVLLFTIFIVWSRKIIIDKRFQAFINKQLGRHRGQIVNELQAHVQTESCLVRDDVRRVIERSNENVKDAVAKVKNQIVTEIGINTDKQIQYQNRDLADVIEKEAYLSRELAHSQDEGFRSVYEFYFPVRNFDKRIGSGVWVFSCPWYINQFQSCLKGAVWFKPDGTVFIKLIDGRYPKVVGLKPKPRSSFSFKVSVVDEGGKIPEKLLGGSHVGEHDEMRQGILLGIWGDWIGSFSCLKLKQDGYVKCGTLLVKYVITVQDTTDGLVSPTARPRITSRHGFLMGRPLSVQH